MMALASSDDLVEAGPYAQGGRRSRPAWEPQYAYAGSTAPGSAPEVGVFVLEAIATEGRTFRATPFFLALDISRQGDLFVASSEEVHLEGQGETLPAALQDFGENLEFQWIGLVESPKEELTAEALKVREVLERRFQVTLR